MVIWSLRWCGMNRWRTKNIQGVKIFCIYHNIGYIALVIIYCPNQCIKGFSGSSVGKESSSNAGDPGWIPGQGRKDRLPTLEFLDFPCGSAGKESACNSGDLGLIPGVGRSPGEEKGYPHQYSGLENSMDSPWGCKELDSTLTFTFSLSSSRLLSFRRIVGRSLLLQEIK